MMTITPSIIVCLILITSGALLYFCNSLLINYKILETSNLEYAWLQKGATNLLGYSTILIPGYLAFQYIKKIKYLEQRGTSLINRIIFKCYKGDELIEKTTAKTKQSKERPPLQEAFLMLFYFAGLQIASGTANFLQEKIMTQTYENANGNERFQDSQFLVFFNRIVAFLLSASIVYIFKQPNHGCPYYKYAFSSTSNILGSWSLYEALKYVNFPTQVIAKSCKPIPVMIMGKFIAKTKYKPYEYFTTTILFIGVGLFMISTGKNSQNNTTTVSGIGLLCVFVVLDAFTANWQGKLFKQYKMSPVQMMCSTNLFSLAFTAISLSQQSSFYTSFNFIANYPYFLVDCLLLSLASAVAQLFIYSTISTFGPLIFAIFTTVRQGVSILLSCLIFKHYISFMGISGIVTVFVSIILRICFGYYQKVKKRKDNTETAESKA